MLYIFVFHPLMTIDSFVGCFDWLLVQMVILFLCIIYILNFIKYIVSRDFPFFCRLLLHCINHFFLVTKGRLYNFTKSPYQLLALIPEQWNRIQEDFTHTYDVRVLFFLFFINSFMSYIKESVPFEVDFYVKWELGVN